MPSACVILVYSDPYVCLALLFLTLALLSSVSFCLLSLLCCRCIGCTAEREHQVPAHAPSAARAQEEVQDYLQGVASHYVPGLSDDYTYKFL